MGFYIRNTFLFYLLFLVNVVNGQGQDNVKVLYRNLLSNYTREIMPLANYSQPLEVGVTLYLGSINSVKEVEEIVSLLVSLTLNWTDPSLSWNPSMYSNLYSFVIDPKDIWLPPLFLLSRDDKLEPIGHGVTFLTTIVYTGEVYYSPGNNLQARCRTDISKFPFDTQECTIEILPWGLLSSKLSFTSLYDTAQLDWYTAKSDWDLQDYTVSVKTRHGYNIITFNLKIKRKPLYYSVMIILPTLLFALLNPQVFTLPNDSGERISMALTILLSNAIFLNLVSASIPETSNPICVLLVVMVAFIGISGIMALGVIQSAKYYQCKRINKAWTPLKRFIIWVIQNKDNDVAPEDNDVAPEDNDEAPEITEKEILISGRNIAYAIDFFCFCGSYFFVAVTIILYFIYVVI